MEICKTVIYCNDGGEMDYSKDPVLTFLVEENFKKLTQNLIEQRRKGNHIYLEQISETLQPGKAEDERGRFFQLLKLVHPDRISWHRQRYKKACMEKTSLMQEWYRRFCNLKINSDKVKGILPEKYSYEEYNYSSEDFNDSFDSKDWDYQDDWVHEETGEERDFLQAVKEAILGNLDLGFSPEDLESLTGELDLSSRDIETMEGAENLRMLDVLNLADNRIERIRGMENLYNLKELNISHNNLTDLSGLEYLNSLEYLDLSFNSLEDIESIYSLENLQVVVLQGNPQIPPSQIQYLEKKKIICII